MVHGEYRWRDGRWFMFPIGDAIPEDVYWDDGWSLPLPKLEYD